MKKTDVIILGHGPSAIRIANTLADQKRLVTVVATGQNFDSEFHQLLKTLADPHTPALPLPELSSSVTVVNGSAQFISPTEVNVNGENYQAKKIVVATGFTPINPFGDLSSFENVVLPWFINSAKKLPSTAVIVGGGPIGVAVACYLQARQCEVTLVSRSERLLEGLDTYISEKVLHSLVARGIRVEIDATAQKVTTHGSHKTLTYSKGGIVQKVEAECVVLAAGLAPSTGQLNLKAADIYCDATGAIITMEDMKTSSGKAWAVGAVTGKPMGPDIEKYALQLVIHNIFNHYIDFQRMDWEPLPLFIPLIPPLASLGMTTDEALEAHRDARVATHEFSDGCIKLIARKRSGTLLGVHIFSPEAASMILYFNLAMRAGLSVRELLDEQHYPMFSKAEEMFKVLKKWSESN